MNTVWDLKSKKPEQKNKETKQNKKTSRQNKIKQNKNQTSGLGTFHLLKVGEYQGTYARLLKCQYKVIQ